MDKAVVTRKLIEELGFTQRTNGSLYGGECPACGVSEAYTPPDNPHLIICGRLNNCGIRTLTKSLCPDLYSVIKNNPPNSQNPNATAHAYLEARGLKVDKIKDSKWQQSNRYIGLDKDRKKIHWPSVSFMLTNASENHRLIDWNGKDKTRAEGSFKGHVWEASWIREKIKAHNLTDLWLVEGGIDALSLHQIGIDAVAIISATHVPDVYLEKLVEDCKGKLPTLTVALDSDKAGRRGAVKLIKHARTLGFEVTQALPPRSLDWNDLLQRGMLYKADAPAIQTALFNGQLEMAVDVKKVFALLAVKYSVEFLRFEWKGKYWRGHMVKGEVYVVRISDFVLHSKYIMRYSDPITGEIVHKITAQIVSGIGENDIEFEGSHLMSSSEFGKRCFVGGVGYWKGAANDLEWLVERLLHRTIPVVSEISVVGYDNESDCYFFADGGYGVDGNPLRMDAYGFWVYKDKHYFLNASSDEKHLPRPDGFDFSEFLTALDDVYGDNGAVCVGFLTAALFAEQFSQSLPKAFFPFLSLYGPPGVGKSTLTELLHALCGRDVQEGTNVAKSNTFKGITRTLASVSNLPIPILEMNDETYGRFDSNVMLNVYDRGQSSVVAVKSHDNRTRKTEMRGALMFVQNQEPFKGTALKERICSLHIGGDRRNVESYKRLLNMRSLCPTFRHHILTNRKNALQALQVSYAECLEILGVEKRNARIVKNYAVLLAGFYVASAVFEGVEKANQRTQALLPHVSACIDASIKKSKEDEDYLCLFLETVSRMMNTPVCYKRKDGEQVWEDLISDHRNKRTPEGVICLSMEEIKRAFEKTNTRYDIEKVMRMAKVSSSFIEKKKMHSAIENKPMNLWIFHKKALQGEEDSHAADHNEDDCSWNEIPF